MTNNKKSSPKFSDFEKEAIRNRAKELKAEARVNKNRAEGEKVVQEAIAAMPESDRSMAKAIHKIVSEVAPELMPKTWYGMPAYATKDGKVVCFFQAADKFKSKYSTFGFNHDNANLDEGNMWASSFSLKKLTAAEEAEIAELVEKAVS